MDGHVNWMLFDEVMSLNNAAANNGPFTKFRDPDGDGAKLTPVNN